MAMEERNGRTYYYRKTRVGGRVRSVYAGSGDLATLWALMDAEKREERQAEREARKAEEDREREEERTVSDWFDGIEAAADAAMFAAGFHRHKAQWRRRRHG